MARQTEQKGKMGKDRENRYVVRTIKDSNINKISERDYTSVKGAFEGFNRSVGMMKKRRYLDRHVECVWIRDGKEHRLRSWSSDEHWDRMCSAIDDAKAEEEI